MIGINSKQGEMLAFIESFVSENGYPPTREEIRTGLNISTKSLVNYHLEALENAALITRIPNTPRGLRLTCGNDALFSASKPTPSNNPSTEDAMFEVLQLTYGMVTNGTNLYAVKAAGDTIVSDQTKHGDVIILQRQNYAQNGEMVAVRLASRSEKKLKRYYRENGHVRLEPANTATEAIIVKPGAVEIEGKVVAVIKELDQVV